VSRATPRRAVGLALLLAGISSCAPRAPETPERPNVVLVTIDTLRADRLGAYGNDSGLTPHLDRLAREGVLFENASAAAPLTLPAHASILTGTYPLHHGIRDNGGYHLGAASVTLAETMQSRGYRTGAFVGAFVLDSRWGLDQGFDRYFDDFDFESFDDVSLGAVSRPGDEVIAEALRFLNEAKPGPFFAWVHLYDPHAPYDPPEPYRGLHASRRYGLYDGEVAHTDELVGRLLEWLSRESLQENTLVAVMGDHGESLEEHGELDHGFFVYDATMNVPFLIKGPGLEAANLRVQAQVRSIDLMPTVLELVGAEVPPAVQGVSLVPLARGEKATLDLSAYRESLYPRLHYGWSELRSLRSEKFHFIDAPAPELYDLRSDPKEERNLASERPEALSELRSRLEEERQRSSEDALPPKEPEALDEKTREMLTALGYLGGPRRSAASASEASSLADPKDKIEIHRTVKAAEALLAEGKVDEALRDVERILSLDRDVVEAHRIRGDAYRMKKDLPRAAAAYREALALDPDYKVAAFHLALSDLALGRPDAAEAGLRRVLQIDPRDNKSYFLLAKLLASRSDHGAALEVLDRGIELAGNGAPFQTARAEILLSRKDLDGAERAALAALEIDAKSPRAHHYLGVIREARGDISGAIDAYEKELARFPHDPATFLNLAELYRKEARRADEIRVLEEALARSPRLGVIAVHLGRAYLDAGDRERARSLIRQGLDGPLDAATESIARELLSKKLN
jgi:arylsulfatase A-like enzyme/Tfp pilus assembly protein PilF